MRKKDSHFFPWMLEFQFQQQTPPQVGSILEADEREDPERVIAAWFESVGPLTARNARPLKFAGGILHVRVRNPIWLQELNLHKGRLIQDLNEQLEGFIVRGLKLEVGLLPPMPESQEPSKPQFQKRELPPHLLDEIEEKLAHLPENDLKQSARRIMANHYKLTRLRDPLDP